MCCDDKARPRAGIKICNKKLSLLAVPRETRMAVLFAKPNQFSLGLIE